jgi:hypothetical protein
LVSLILALLLLGIAGVGLSLWGCLGPAGVGWLAIAAGAAASGLALLALWLIFCGDCPTIRFLQRFFGAMALVMLVLTALFVLTGQIGCSLGTAAVAALFGVIVGALTIGAAARQCP